MSRRPPLPLCKAFLACHKIEGDTLTLLGQKNCYQSRHFPNGCPLSFFVRLTGGHGEYAIEVQLQNSHGEVFWRDGPPQPWTPQSPLATLDLRLNLIPVFPGPGDYAFVLMANGEELSREHISTELLTSTGNQGS